MLALAYGAGITAQACAVALSTFRCLQLWQMIWSKIGNLLY